MRLVIFCLILVGAGVTSWNYIPTPLPENWTEQERALIRAMALDQLPALPPDPSNHIADDDVAARLGQRLYFDTRLSSNNAVSCATCHKPELYFTDGLKLAVGLDVGDRHTPSLVGLSHSPWFYWDGRKDSQWSQALAPLESAHEHGTSRLQVSRLLATDPVYRELYESLFDNLPTIPGHPINASPEGNLESQRNWNALSKEQQDSINRIFSNVGKSIAAYQRKILPGTSRFDEYAMALSESSLVRSSESLSSPEIAGLSLFIGKGQCVSCHNGPLFTNHDFHNTGVLSLTADLPPMGRYDGIRQARDDVFNCLGVFSDAASSECIELRFARDTNDLVGAHKTPTLRNVTETAPYMHGGQLNTLQEVLDHYNEAPVSMLSHNEAKPLKLRPVELNQLESFMEALTAPLSTSSQWLSPPSDL